MRRKPDENPPAEAKQDWVSIEVVARPEPPPDPAPSTTPPPPHDPADRVLVTTIGEWEVRRFPEDGKLFLYAAPRGMLHLQLWHPGRRVSVLTPSRVTGRRYEIFPSNGWKRTTGDWRSLTQAVRFEHQLALPGSARLAALESWYVAGPERAAVRAHIAARVRTR